MTEIAKMGRVLRCAQSAQPPYTLPVWQWHLLPVPSRVEQKKRNPVRTRSLALSASQAMAATGTAVSTAAASLPPRGLRQDPPSSLRKRHCAAVRPLAASPTATSGRWPSACFFRISPLRFMAISSPPPPCVTSLCHICCQVTPRRWRAPRGGRCLWLGLPRPPPSSPGGLTRRHVSLIFLCIYQSA